MKTYTGKFVALAMACLALAVTPLRALELKYTVTATHSISDTHNWAYAIPGSTPLIYFPSQLDVTINVPEGSDTVTWSFVFNGDTITSKACRACAKDGGLDLMLDQSPLSSTGILSDTEQVSIQGASYTYLRYSTPGARGAYSSYTDKTILKGVATAYYSEGTYAPGTNTGVWNNTFRLREFNGIRIDSLWSAGVLAGPVPIFPASRRAEPRFAPRKFDLREMGIFLGRKSALREPLPKTR
jgi:hypothetical protein